MNEKKIIAFYGAQQAGKSSAADAVAARPGWSKLSFADPLYEMLSVVLDVDARKVSKEAPLGPLCGKSVRQALQTLGTQWGRLMVGEDIWLRHMRWRIEKAPGNVVIDDMRFGNEYEMLRDLDGPNALLILVDRDGIGAGDAHASEQDWPSFEHDLKFHNTFRSAQTWQEAVRNTLRSTGILD